MAHLAWIASEPGPEPVCRTKPSYCRSCTRRRSRVLAGILCNSLSTTLCAAYSSRGTCPSRFSRLLGANLPTVARGGRNEAMKIYLRANRTATLRALRVGSHTCRLFSISGLTTIFTPRIFFGRIHRPKPRSLVFLMWILPIVPTQFTILLPRSSAMEWNSCKSTAHRATHFFLEQIDAPAEWLRGIAPFRARKRYPRTGHIVRLELRTTGNSHSRKARASWATRLIIPPRDEQREGRPDLSAGSVDNRALTETMKSYFAGELSLIDTVPTQTAGMPFQGKAWRSLREIPCGLTISYGA
jgi:hypothetical protein